MGLLKELAPKPRTGPPPPHLDQSLYCHYHQNMGHATDNCIRLKHEVQNLIDAGKIIDPDAS